MEKVSTGFNTKSFDFSFDSSSLSSGVGFSGGSGAVSQSGVVNSESDAATDSKTDAEKEYIDIEFNTLTGDCSVLPTKQNMKLKVGNTIKMLGVGKFLSGLYFISEIKRTISNDGAYSMSLVLYKNGFGDNFKSTSNSVTTTPANNGRPTEVDTSKMLLQQLLKLVVKLKLSEMLFIQMLMRV